MVSTRVSHEALSYVETIANLAYIIQLDAEDSTVVRAYAGEVQEQAIALGAFLRSVTQQAFGPNHVAWEFSQGRGNFEP